MCPLRLCCLCSGLTGHNTPLQMFGKISIITVYVFRVEVFQRERERKKMTSEALNSFPPCSQLAHSRPPSSCFGWLETRTCDVATSHCCFHYLSPSAQLIPQKRILQSWPPRLSQERIMYERQPLICILRLGRVGADGGDEATEYGLHILYYHVIGKQESRMVLMAWRRNGGRAP